VQCYNFSTLEAIPKRQRRFCIVRPFIRPPPHNYPFPASLLLHGGVAQWLGCRSLAGGLSLIYAWSMVDMWPLRG